MAIRQFLLPMAMTLPFTVLQLAFEPYLFDVNYWTDPTYYDVSLFSSLGSLLMSLLSLAVSLLDALWIFKGGQNRRIVDVWAKTDVLNTSATVRN
jgi:uncharacterized membrane protein